MSDPLPPPVPGQQPTKERKGPGIGCIVAIVVGLFGIGVVGVIVALVIPSSFGLIKRTKLVKTKAEIKDVQLGIKNFYLEYARGPVAQEEMDAPLLSQGHVLDALLGRDQKLNPRGIAFIEPPGTQQGKGPGLYEGTSGYVLIDSWGNPLRVALKRPPATAIADPETPGKMIEATVLVWSAGPDGNFDTWQDNLASWKP